MAINIFNSYQYRPVPATAALPALAQSEHIFIGDTHHHSQKTQAALLDVFGQLAGQGHHQDLCLEHNSAELAEPRHYVVNNWPQLQASSLCRFDFDSFCALDMAALAARQGRPSATSMLLSLTAIYMLVAAHQRNVSVHGVDLANKQAGPPLLVRLGQDHEVAANIRQAVGQRPFICIYGASHLRPGGLPRHFSEGSSARVWVFGDGQEFRHSRLEQTVCLWTDRYRVTPPDYMYWGAERQFFRRQTPLWRNSI